MNQPQGRGASASSSWGGALPRNAPPGGTPRTPRGIVTPAARRMAAAGGIAALFVAWQVAASRWPPHVLPGPAVVCATMVEMRAELLDHALRSGGRVLKGYTLAAAVGIPLAGAMGAWRWLDRQLGALLALLRAVPPFAWTPLLLLWLGIGDVSAVLVVFLGALFPIVRFARAGIAAVPAALPIAARNLGASRLTVIRRVLLPGALPSTFAGLKLGWTLAWMSVVAAELVGADRGLGQLVLDARNLARPDVALAGMVCIGALAAFSEAGLSAAERRLLRWRA